MNWAIAVFAIVPLFILGGVGFAVMKATKMAGSAITRYEASGSPLLSDINGDGHVDIVGRTSVYDTNDSFLRYYLTAYDGLSGAKFWTSASIGTSEVWQVTMGEKLVSLCSTGPKSLVLALNDKSWKRFALSDGKLSPAIDRPENCKKIASYERYGKSDIYLGTAERSRAKREIFAFEAREREASSESSEKLQAISKDTGADRFERKAASDELAEVGNKRREREATATKQMDLDFLDVSRLKIAGMQVVDSIKLEKPGWQTQDTRGETLASA